jgi:hypothetical protein
MSVGILTIAENCSIIKFMNMKIFIILMVIILMSCQKKESSHPNVDSAINNISIENSEYKNISEENIIMEQSSITINSLEGYHMDSLTIIKLFVEDEIVKVETLFWGDNEIMYSEAISLELFSGNDWMSLDNYYYFRPNINTGSYSLIIKTDRFLINSTNVLYEYLGKNITNEIIAAISEQQNEFTGKYIYSKMESSETIETLLEDNNLQKPQKTLSDFVNSYITITFAGNGKLIVGASKGLRESILFWGDKYFYLYETDIESEFYGHSGDSFVQSFSLEYYFNEELEIVVHLIMYNHAIYDQYGEKIIKEKKTNEYKIIYKNDIVK